MRPQSQVRNRGRFENMLPTPEGSKKAAPILGAAFCCQELPTCGNFQFGANVLSDFCGIEINEMPDTVMRDAAQFGPIAKRADRGLFSLWENTAQAQARDIGQLIWIQDSG